MTFYKKLTDRAYDPLFSKQEEKEEKKMKIVKGR